MTTRHRPRYAPRQRERARLPSVEIRKRILIRIDVVHARPACLDRGRQFLCAGVIPARQHLVAHGT